MCVCPPQPYEEGPSASKPLPQVPTGIYRKNRRVARLLREARLRQTGACMEDVDYRTPRGLDRSVMESLGRGQWIERHQDVLISGPTGVGKSWIGCALANAACRLGHSARYARVPRLLEEIRLSQGDGSYERLMIQLGRVEVLVLDDFGLAPLSATEGRLLLEVVDDRSERKSTVVASQLPVQDWHGLIADATVADAILDRWVHRAHRITLQGDSLRRIHSRQDGARGSE
ncbi:MAG: IS21-like element helper ATPase IstB [Candidatus Saccharimonadales bacterium]